MQALLFPLPCQKVTEEGGIVTEQRFLALLQDTIRYNQLERYFDGGPGRVETVETPYDLIPDVAAIRADMADPGGLKLSHAQRRMLMVLVALWDGGTADRLFEEGLGRLSRIIMSMDKTNRARLAEIITIYPGWG